MYICDYCLLECSAVSSTSVFLNHRVAVRYRDLSSIIPRPRLIQKKSIYRAAVLQRLRTTALYDCYQRFGRTSITIFHNTNIVFGHYPSSCFNLKHRQVKPTQLGPTDRASLYLRRQNPISETLWFEI
jgi:hypothetical protein